MADEPIKGLKDLLADLQALPANMQKNSLRTSIFKGAQDLAAKVAAAAPVNTGSLKESIKAKRSRGKAGEVAAGIGGNYITKWVEFGHLLTKGKRRNGGKVVGHVPANPFIARTFEANKESLVNAIREGLAGAIEKGMRKLKKGL
jgi:HK97 gp10 family phage protein